MTQTLTAPKPTQADFERAAREFKQSALGLAQTWHVLGKTGWSQAQLRPVLLALRQLSKGCDRLRLASLRKRTQDLENLLVPFVSGMLPASEQIPQIDAAVSMLTSSALTLDLSQMTPGFAFVPAANDAHADKPIIDKINTDKLAADKQNRGASESFSKASSAPYVQAQSARLADPNLILLLRADRDLARGIETLLGERGYRVVEIATTIDLEASLRSTLPGGVIADARFLNGITRQLNALKARANSAEVDARVVVVSDRRDLARRLLATRNGVQGYFEDPLDLMEVVHALGLREGTPSKPALAAQSALICSPNSQLANDCASWLKDAQVETRIERQPMGALTALVEMHPQLIVVDGHEQESTALRLVSELRKLTRFANPPIILFLGSNLLSAREDAIAAGADEYLIAPFRSRHLLSVSKSRLERAKRQREQDAYTPKAKSGLLSRNEFLAEFLHAKDLSLVFFAIDQIDALAASVTVSGLDDLDAAIAALVRPRLKLKEMLGYYQDGQYLIGVRSNQERTLAELAEKLRASLMNARIDIGTGAIRLTASAAYTTLPSDGHPQKQLEQAMHTLRHCVRNIQANGGNFVRSAQAVVLESPIERGATPDVPSGLKCQALLPLVGKLQQQYLLRFEWRHHDQVHFYAQASRESAAAGFLQEFDRRLVHAALNLRASELKRGNQVRLMLEIGSSALEDAGFASWLTAELNQYKLSGSGLSLMCDIYVAATHPRAWQKLMVALHPFGMRFGLHNFLDVDSIVILGQLHYDFAMVSARVFNQLDLEQYAKRVHERGAALIVSDVENRTALDLLRSSRADYGTCAGVADFMHFPNFDFVGFSKSS